MHCGVSIGTGRLGIAQMMFLIRRGFKSGSHYDELNFYVALGSENFVLRYQRLDSN